MEPVYTVVAKVGDLRVDVFRGTPNPREGCTVAFNCEVVSPSDGKPVLVFHNGEAHDFYFDKNHKPYMIQNLYGNKFWYYHGRLEIGPDTALDRLWGIPGMASLGTSAVNYGVVANGISGSERVSGDSTPLAQIMAGTGPPADCPVPGIPNCPSSDSSGYDGVVLAVLLAIGGYFAYRWISGGK